jgi:hypothetical protein
MTIESPARWLDTLETAITQALAAVTTDNAVAWFRYCGHRMPNYETAFVLMAQLSILHIESLSTSFLKIAENGTSN